MAWFCQRECYATTFETTIESCEASNENSLKAAGLVNDASGTLYDIVFADTVLFPEGGGQPDDRGTVEVVETGEQINILRVLRNGQRAVHYARLAAELQVGAGVRQQVDWVRRFDHMQQHSGQHLITALVERRFGWKTTSWNLGELISTIELEKVSDSGANATSQKAAEKPAAKGDAKNTCELDAAEIEKVINEHILQDLPITVKLINSLDDPELKKARSRGLPADVPLPIRLVSIGEGEACLDANLCCGTHVRRIGDLQSISILAVVSAKKGRATLSFLSGQRVLRYVRASYANERQLTAMLNVPADQHVEALKRTQAELRVATKANLTLLREAAISEARCFFLEKQSNSSRLILYSTHRKDADTEFMNVLANELDRLFLSDVAKSDKSNAEKSSQEPSQEVVAFLSVGDERKDGNFLLAAPAKVLGQLSGRVNELLEAKAFANKAGTRYQGRSGKMVARKNVLEFLNDFVAQQQNA